MKSILSHSTALAFWRNCFPLDGEMGNPVHVSEAEVVTGDKNAVMDVVPDACLRDGRPLDVMVFDQARRGRSSLIRAHVHSTPIPSGAFHKEGHLYVSSPEFVFLQLASELSIVQLVALADELCGNYVLVPKGEVHPSTFDEFPERATPLTNLERLSDFLDAAKGSRGCAKAQRALRYVVEGSRSFMESVVSIQLCLPVMLGGYGFPLPTMNETIDLDEEAQKVAQRQHCDGDLCWGGDVRLDIEYHGDVHVGSAPMRSDVGRELGIERMEWKVITVTYPQVVNIDQFEVVASEAAKRLGKRLYKKDMGMTQERMRLHDELYAWKDAAYPMVRG